MGGFSESTIEDFDISPETGVAKDDLFAVAKKLYNIPEEKQLFKKSLTLLSDRKKMVEDTDKIDWAMAELLAYGTLLQEGHLFVLADKMLSEELSRIDITIFKSEESEQYPLNSVGDVAKFTAFNSLLSEYGVLGFDYGYAMAKFVNHLGTQFGDSVMVLKLC